MTGWVPAQPDGLLDLAGWDALPAATGHRTELAEGVLSVVPLPGSAHLRVENRLPVLLEPVLARGLVARGGVQVLVDPAAVPTVRVPDVVVVPAGLAGARRVLASEVLLAVEVVWPGTVGTDRVTKPVEYGRAGVGLY